MLPERACFLSGAETVVGGAGDNFIFSEAQMSLDAQHSASVGGGHLLPYFWLGSTPGIVLLQEL